MKSILSIPMLLLQLLLLFMGSAAGTLIAPYQINWTQEIDANVTVNGLFSSINTDENASILSDAVQNLSETWSNLTPTMANLTAAQENITTIQAYLNDNVSPGIVTLQIDLASNSSRIGTLETDLGNNASRITALEGYSSSNSTRIGCLESNLSLNSSRIDTLETDTAANASRIETLESDLALNSSRIDAANSTHLALEGGTMSNNITMSGYKLLNQTLELAPPSGPQNGSIYYNLTDHKIYVYDNSSWLATDALV